MFYWVKHWTLNWRLWLHCWYVCGWLGMGLLNFGGGKKMKNSSSKWWNWVRQFNQSSPVLDNHTNSLSNCVFFWGGVNVIFHWPQFGVNKSLPLLQAQQGGVSDTIHWVLSQSQNMLVRALIDRAAGTWTRTVSLGKLCHFAYSPSKY